MVSEARDLLDRSLPLIKSLIALCPLLGLLGTVTGMIEVFEVMSLRGTGDAPGLAGGVGIARKTRVFPALFAIHAENPPPLFAYSVKVQTENMKLALPQLIRFGAIKRGRVVFCRRVGT